MPCMRMFGTQVLAQQSPPSNWHSGTFKSASQKPLLTREVPPEGMTSGQAPPAAMRLVLKTGLIAWLFVDDRTYSAAERFLIDERVFERSMSEHHSRFTKMVVRLFVISGLSCYAAG